MVHDLGEEWDRVGLQVDLLEVGVEIAVERRDRAVRRLPGDVEHVGGVGHLAAHRVGDHPVELAPSGIQAGFFPRNLHGASIGPLGEEAPVLDVGGSPRDRRALAAERSVTCDVGCVLAELHLDEPIRLALSGSESLVAHDLAKAPTGRLPRCRLDVDPFEVVAVARVGLHLGLRG